MKEMSKTYAIVEVIEGEQIQLVRRKVFLISLLSSGWNLCFSEPLQRMIQQQQQQQQR